VTFVRSFTAFSVGRRRWFVRFSRA